MLSQIQINFYLISSQIYLPQPIKLKLWFQKVLFDHSFATRVVLNNVKIKLIRVYFFKSHRPKNFHSKPLDLFPNQGFQYVQIPSLLTVRSVTNQSKPGCTFDAYLYISQTALRNQDLGFFVSLFLFSFIWGKIENKGFLVQLELNVNIYKWSRNKNLQSYYNRFSCS